MLKVLFLVHHSLTVRSHGKASSNSDLRKLNNRIIKMLLLFFQKSGLHGITLRNKDTEFLIP